jgi:mannose-6-phosphate isomerase-like protein (cupin superfamily)
MRTEQGVIHMHGTQKRAVEIYAYDGPGYRPLLSSEGWMIAWLNYLDAAKPENVKDLERHDYTNEVFVLVEGKADLLIKGEHGLEFITMEKGKAYSVGPGIWHGLVMQEGAQCFIVKSAERSGGKDVRHLALEAAETDRIRQYYQV